MSQSTKQSEIAQTLYNAVKDHAILSPHGHTDPNWFSLDRPFSDPAELLVIPDHYVFRMLYSQGVAMEDLGIGVAAELRKPREIFRHLAKSWPLLLGTPSRMWLEYTFQNVFGITQNLSIETSDAIYDQIAAALASEAYRPRTLLRKFDIAVLATTDGALDPLHQHKAFAALGEQARLIPTFRPDTVLNPASPDFAAHVVQMGALTGENTALLAGYRAALASRRAYFKAHGATATDHDVPDFATELLADSAVQSLLDRALNGTISPQDAIRFYNHMLIEMAQMSVEDGLVMQIHAGNRRSTNAQVLARFGRDMGADIPHAADWVHGANALLNRVGNNPALHIIAFTLDESVYARELAPMAGHWPALRLGPPWWFHDSPLGIRRYFDSVVESAGYFNLAGFNDDTRALMSIPARHDMWRRAISTHLAEQVSAGKFAASDAHDLAQWLVVGAVRSAYKLGA